MANGYQLVLLTEFAGGKIYFWVRKNFGAVLGRGNTTSLKLTLQALNDIIFCGFATRGLFPLTAVPRFYPKQLAPGQRCWFLRIGNIGEQNRWYGLTTSQFPFETPRERWKDRGRTMNFLNCNGGAVGDHRFSASGRRGILLLGGGGGLIRACSSRLDDN